jgi:hypothetical protein
VSNVEVCVCSDGSVCALMEVRVCALMEVCVVLMIVIMRGNDGSMYDNSDGSALCVCGNVCSVEYVMILMIECVLNREIPYYSNQRR